MDGFLFQALIYLAAAVIAVPVAARLGLGSVLGYLIAGILIGPVFHLVGSETADIQHFAEFGVVMMLFVVGLELEPSMLWRMRRELIGLGGLQLLLTTLLITVVATLLGLAWQTALAVGLILSLSSTAIVLQTLGEKGLMKTKGGRSSFSVLLFQDVAVIPILAFLPLLALGAVTGSAHDDGGHGAGGTIFDGFSTWVRVLGTIGAVAAVVLVGQFLTRPVFRFIATARLRDLFTAVALLIVVSIAVLMDLVGLSAALGTFIAGVVLATSEYRHELEADIAPFKGLLLGLFFITVGAGIDLSLLSANLTIILAATVGVIAVKAAVLYLIAGIFALPRAQRWLFTLALAQAGEFGFVLLSLALSAHVLTPDQGAQLSLIVALSMLLTPALFILYDRFFSSTGAPKEEAPDEIDETAPIIIAGQGRFGQIVNRILLSQGFHTVVLDNKSDLIERLRPFGVKAFFGDPTRVDLLNAAGLKDARVLVCAIDDVEQAIKLVNLVRSERPDIHIVARARDRDHVYHLHNAGADDIIRETFDSAVRSAREALVALGQSKGRAEKITHAFFEHDRTVIRKLSAVWDPAKPNAANEEYVALAKELNNDIARVLEGLELDDEIEEEPPKP